MQCLCPSNQAEMRCSRICFNNITKNFKEKEAGEGIATGCCVQEAGKEEEEGGEG